METFAAAFDNIADAVNVTAEGMAKLISLYKKAQEYFKGLADKNVGAGFEDVVNYAGQASGQADIMARKELMRQGFNVQRTDTCLYENDGRRNI